MIVDVERSIAGYPAGSEQRYRKRLEDHSSVCATPTVCQMYVPVSTPCSGPNYLVDAVR